jgi:hypothetical protein
MTKQELDAIRSLNDKGYSLLVGDTNLLLNEIDRLRQVLSDIVNPAHDDRHACSIRCSRCYDPRQIAQEALGEE